MGTGHILVDRCGIGHNVIEYTGAGHISFGYPSIGRISIRHISICHTGDAGHILIGQGGGGHPRFTTSFLTDFWTGSTLLNLVY